MVKLLLTQRCPASKLPLNAEYVYAAQPALSLFAQGLIAKQAEKRFAYNGAQPVEIRNPRCASVPNLLQKIASRAGSGSLLPGSDHQKRSVFQWLQSAIPKPPSRRKGPSRFPAGFTGSMKAQLAGQRL